MHDPALILIVEDNPVMLRAEKRLFNAAGYETLEANTGSAALTMASEYQPDIMILDVVLPDIDGVEVCKQIKATPRLKNIFILLLSGIRTDSAVRAIGLESGADDYLVKPISNRELLARVSMILKLRQTQENLKNNEEKFHLVFNEINIGLALHEIIFNEEGRAVDFIYLDCNPMFEMIMGLKAKMMIGRRGTEITPLLAQRWLNVYQHVAQTGEAVTIFDQLEESETFIEIKVFSTQKNQFSVALTDITEQKKAELAFTQNHARLEELVNERTQALMAAQEKLARQERLATLGQLAGGIGHELRNPLGVIANAVYLLKTTTPNTNDQTLHYLNLIETNIHNANNIIHNLLDFARAKSPQPQSVTVTDLVAPILDQHKLPKNIRLYVDIPAELPVVRVTPTQIQQIIQNLLSNAVQAMPTGGELKITATAVEQGVQIAVADTGLGIKPEDRPKIFEPLFTTKPNGIGLGLALSKILSKANQCQLDFESRPQKGTIFRLRLPCS